MSDAESIGTIFREARKKKGVTASKAAAATRIKVQCIEAMENDDFSGIAAPAYAKGFIKLYAEYLGLDHKPLVEEYLQKHVKGPRSPLTRTEPSRDGGKKMAETSRQLVSIIKGIPREKLLQAGAIVAGLLIAVSLIMGVSRLARSCDSKAAEEMRSAVEKHKILQEPPEPYL